jgi:hypothetical protein
MSRWLALDSGGDFPPLLQVEARRLKMEGRQHRTGAAASTTFFLCHAENPAAKSVTPEFLRQKKTAQSEAQAGGSDARPLVGFTGASGAVLIGVAPLWGMVTLTVAAGIGMGAMDERLGGRDVAIGIVLALSLGLGLLFLHFFTA